MRIRPTRPVLRPLGACLVALLLATLLAACGDEDNTPTPSSTAATTTAVAASSTPTAAPTFPLTVTDSAGTSVTIPAAPKRIIALSAASTEILYAIGAGPQVVATDKFSSYPDAATRTARLEYTKPDPEAALALSPDLVVMASRQKDQVAQFRGLGMTVVYISEAATVDAVYGNIALFGRFTGHDAEASLLVSGMRERIGAVTSKLTDVTAGPRVFFEVTKDLYTAAPNTFIGSMLTLVKAQNIAAGAASAFPQLSAEAVIAADPEVVFLADVTSAGESPASVAARPGWSEVSAVKNRRIVALDNDTASRPGPRIVEAIEAMARALYPDRFR